jgi:hypothetical protein
MKIAVFYPAGSTAWSITKGVCSAFSKMKHIITDCGSEYKESLEYYDMIFVSGPEYLWKDLRTAYPQWDSLPGIKVGWLHETVEREDYKTNPIAIDGKLPIGELKKLTPHLFTPAIQDQKYELPFLPFGVDEDKFCPGHKEEYGSIYTGSLYKKRKDLLNLYPEIRSLAGYRDYATIDQYIDAIKGATVVLNLPSLSEASNTRTFEVLASKTMLIAPAMLYPDGIFEDGVHLLYYQGSPVSAFEKVKDLAGTLAQQGYDEVLRKHTITHRMKTVLDAVGFRPMRFSRKR